MVAKKKTSKTTETKKSKAKQISVIHLDGKPATMIEAPDVIFGVNASPKLIAQYIRVFLTNQRQGNAHVKTRGEVQASTRKIYRQKGTGRARHGAKSAPIFVGGGVAHGPKVKTFSLKLNKKQKRKALYYSLSLKLSSDKIAIINGLETMKGKTTNVKKALNDLEQLKSRKALLVYAQNEVKSGAMRSFLNLENIKPVNVRILNAYEVINADNIFFTKDGYEDFLKFRNVQ